MARRWVAAEALHCKRRHQDQESHERSGCTVDASSKWGEAQAARAARATPTMRSKLRELLCGFNLVLVVGWFVSVLLVVHVKNSRESETKIFDPYSILNISMGSDISVIKKAYRKLSLQYHPDKNPNPEAHLFFTDSITPAYKALTDDAARENFEKHGHPDGKQPVRLGVALLNGCLVKTARVHLFSASLLALVYSSHLVLLLSPS